jgi:hypothetical protein
VVGGWWLVVGGWWVVGGGWWLVVGGWWVVVGGWWVVADVRLMAAVAAVAVVRAGEVRGSAVVLVTALAQRAQRAQS